MMRSLYSGVSGLRNHQIRMDVLGNNIANVNTYGFKKSRVSFQDILSQTISGAAAPTAEKGGVNPKQVGLGMDIASIDKVFTQGSLQTTGLNLDLAIQGDGFFIISRGEEQFYTRAGAFGLDKNGTVVNPANGMRVQGWQAVKTGTTYTINTAGDLEDIIVPIGGKDPARATENVKYRSNLNADTPLLPIGRAPTEEERLNAVVTTNIDAYDSIGNVHRLTVDFTRLRGEPNTWLVTASLEGADVIMDVDGPNRNNSNAVVMRFNAQGAPVSIEDSPGVAGAPVDVVNEGRLALNMDVTYIIDGTTQRITLDLGGADEYDGITQFAAPSSTRAYEQDGFGLGYLENFTVDSAGVITGVYSNGNKAPVAQIAMTIFTNPQGLTAE
ncbi:MAG: hypothetical protein AMS17_11745, partial [Spirochaetes bacterium DG_61]